MTGAVKTRSQLGALSRNKGAKAERDLCTWLRPIWPKVDRTQRTGYRTAARQRRDNGDISGTPGITWSVKDAERHYIESWWAELLEMEHEVPLPLEQAPIRLLVVKNNGHSCPADWWCWQSLTQLVELTTNGAYGVGAAGDHLVRCRLETMVTRLRVIGHGVAWRTERDGVW